MVPRDWAVQGLGCADGGYQGRMGRHVAGCTRPSPSRGWTAGGDGQLGLDSSVKRKPNLHPVEQYWVYWRCKLKISMDLAPPPPPPQKKKKSVDKYFLATD